MFLLLLYSSDSRAVLTQNKIFRQKVSLETQSEDIYIYIYIYICIYMLYDGNGKIFSEKQVPGVVSPVWRFQGNIL